jgi:N-acetyl-alpha-D-muramate 1-phosphate uridylyltransferase
MIMAAGLGTRMRPLTDNRPKPLVEVAGKALIDYSLDKLREAEICDVVINVHYLPDMVKAHLAANAQDLNISVSDESGLLLETGGGLIKAQPLLTTDTFYCINSDNIWIETAGNALADLAAEWDDGSMDALLLLVPHAHAFNHNGPGDFFLQKDRQLVRRGNNSDAPFIYSGIQLLSKRLLRNPPNGAFSTNILWDRAIKDGRLFGIAFDGDWFDIGTPSAIAPTEAKLMVNG